MSIFERARMPAARRGFSLTDLCVVIVAMALVVALSVPLLAQQQREAASRIKCASNLRQLALAGILYTQADRAGRFPRTYFNPDPKVPVAVFTGMDAKKAFDAAMGPDFKGPKANDVSASLYHLFKSSDLKPADLVCASSDATPLPKTFIVQDQSNFPGVQHLSYSYSNPFPVTAAVQMGWKFDATISPDFPFASDINPGESKEGGPDKVAFDAPGAKMRSANSPNHWFEGQNVVYVDGHVEWQTTPFCGAPVPQKAYRDNIYVNADGVDEKTAVGGKVQGRPVHRGDSVMLPAAADVPEGAKRTLPVRDPSKAPK